MKKVIIPIENKDGKRQFLALLRQMFKGELKNNTLNVMIKEADTIEFAFKNNGFLRFRKSDIKDFKL